MIIRLATFAMGTRFELVLAGEDESLLRGAGDEAIAEIQEWHSRLSLFQSDSLVAHINRTAHERPVRVDRPTFELFMTAREVWRASGGAFDITMGALMREWGLHAGESTGEAVWGMDGVVLDESALTVSFARPGLAIDLGGIGKGHALDAAAEVLGQRGVTTALMHGGTSSVVGIGAPDDQPQGWRVALGPAGAPVAVLRDVSLSVSGGHGRAVERAGEVVGHVLDPRTGAPARAAGLACAIGRTGRVVEAWSTALLVLGERPASMPRDLVSVIRDSGGAWRVGGDAAGEVVDAI